MNCGTTCCAKIRLRKGDGWVEVVARNYAYLPIFSAVWQLADGVHGLGSVHIRVH